MTDQRSERDNPPPIVDPAIQELERPVKVKRPEPTKLEVQLAEAMRDVRERWPIVLKFLRAMTELEAKPQRLMAPRGLSGAEELVYRAGQRSIVLWLERQGLEKKDE